MAERKQKSAKTYKITELARAYSEDAVRQLAYIMKDASAPHSARVRAAEAILDRAIGRPFTQPDPNSGSQAAKEIADAFSSLADKLPG